MNHLKNRQLLRSLALITVTGAMTTMASGQALLLDDFEAAVPPFPLNLFNIGDSVGEGEAADGTIGSANHAVVWSTGYANNDSVQAINERLEDIDPLAYNENNSTRDAALNQAVSGADMADFAAQAQAVSTAAQSLPDGRADAVAVLLGNNDVCADSLANMTPATEFEAQYRQGLDILAGAGFPDNLNLHISSIPAIYWLWYVKRENTFCRSFIWPFVPCQNLLANAGTDDCASAVSTADPDTIYAGDGAVCQRRKNFHAQIRDVYNPILRDVLAEYQANDSLPNAEYIDIFDSGFEAFHINDGDCFHPSVAGQAMLAEEQWCRSRWGIDNPACTP
ncbi:MAG: SGNH/GDSL hydrolase family protein [Candidatus Competibacteraceae bacterium]|nr:SGNH/GDSL hydrolase family protein [Candidatus Competibacteraceae bacterium]